MDPQARDWDYLILTASNARQADAYEEQLALRRRLGLLAGVGHALVVPDPPGRRIGSGGSTIRCLCEVLQHEAARMGIAPVGEGAWLEVLRPLRVLIVHGGGDSRRLPAYGPCGKLFIPMPADSDSAIPPTLFDCQLPTYLGLPAPPDGMGQFVITSGDVLLGFDPGEVRFDAAGLTGLGCRSDPQRASHHGVFCADPEGRVRLYLQKPSEAIQADRGAIDRYGQAILDIGVMNFDAAMAAAMLKVFQVDCRAEGRLGWGGPLGAAIESAGLDFYREICCALGTETTAEHHAESARAAGSRWGQAELRRLFEALKGTAFCAQVLPRCEFMHFGTTRQIIASGLDYQRVASGVPQAEACLSIRNILDERAALSGRRAWVEACEVRAPLDLGGDNVVVGLEVDEPTSLPAGACIDVLPGQSRDGRPVWFVRCYGVDDTFKESAQGEATFNGRPLNAYLSAIDAGLEDVWGGPNIGDIWEARLFPAEADPAGWRRWLWMFEPTTATPEQRQAWRAADRYSLAQIADLADQTAFNARRTQMRVREIRRGLRVMFRQESGFSAADLAYLIEQTKDRDALLADVLAEACWHLAGDEPVDDRQPLAGGRILHTVGSALGWWVGREATTFADILPRLGDLLGDANRAVLASLELTPESHMRIGAWADRAREAGFASLRQVIVQVGERAAGHPICRLRSDEVVWGRVPARLDLGGGWTDTPPYSLEQGGCVINAAVNLNGQPPIHCYARAIKEPVIRIGSIDLGNRREITELADLLDYRQATSDFALAKAALALSGFSPEATAWPTGATLQEMLRRFGGGIELTTLAAVPKGSGLGTSSIMGTVILAVVQRVMGRSLDRDALFNAVLRMEQAMTTGGGWQDQIGGAIADVKVISTGPGLTPRARVQWVPSDVLDPRVNGRQTLLYYTGITRLAKNILQQVVGRYLDRDRAAMDTLGRLHRLPPLVAEAMARKDITAFGKLIDVAWRLNKQLDPNSSNEAIERLLARAGRHLLGAKLLGAGGGGFLLMVCRSPADAEAVRNMLEADPPNERARFFDFDISREGLVVTVC